ncbi:hypothetical protein [Nocardiopsis sp. CA-288880]|uniref:hypothetical protein n=1 Tax=Nocardiopsis sp. CA-288880 TaxID=3239995 RepID=UPI003D962B24
MRRIIAALALTVAALGTVAVGAAAGIDWGRGYDDHGDHDTVQTLAYGRESNERR